MIDQDGGIKLFDYDEVLAHVTDLTNQNESGKLWVSITSTANISIATVDHAWCCNDALINQIVRSVTSPVIAYHKWYLL